MIICSSVDVCCFWSGDLLRGVIMPFVDASRAQKLRALEAFVARNAALFRSRDGSCLYAKLRTRNSTEEKKWYNFLRAAQFTDEEKAWVRKMYYSVDSGVLTATQEKLRALEVFVGEHVAELRNRQGSCLRARLRKLKRTEETKWYIFLYNAKFTEEEKAWVHKMYESIDPKRVYRRKRLEDLELDVGEHAAVFRSRPGTSWRRCKRNNPR